MPTTVERPMTTASRPGDLDPGSAQDLDRRMRGRRQEAVIAQAQQAGVERVDAVDVLGRIDGVDDRAQPDRRRERHLDDQAVDRRVGVDGPDRRDDGGLGRLALELDELGVDPGPAQPRRICSR